MAKKKIKRYKVSPDESLCLAVSLVNKPAVESDFQFFSEQKIEKFVGVEGERRMIYGCALRPSFPIYRNNGEEEYYLEFSKEAIDKISKNYFKMGFQTNWTEAHKDEVEGLTITESWIKESMTMDKSVALGLDADLPIGTWFIGCYCENDDIWRKVREGSYLGFSIEALIGVEEFEKQVEEINENNMDINETNDMNFWTKMKEVLSEVFTSTSMSARPEEELVAETNEQKAEMIETEMESEEVVTQVEPTVETTTVTDEHGTYEVTEKGDDIEIKPVETQPDPTAVDEPKVEEPKEDTKHLEDLINSLKEEINALKEHNDTLSNRVKEMSKEPSAKPISTVGRNGGGDTYQQWRETMRGLIS